MRNVIEIFNFIATQTKTTKKYDFVDKYGKSNVIIAAICMICLIVNSIFISEAKLNQIESSRLAVYLVNFLVGCQGVLGDIGSMSYAGVFVRGEWWRLIIHMYLHAGIWHVLFNVLALLYAGKVVEKKIGIWPYLLLYHVIAIVNALLMSLIFRDSVSVGASAGIFGMIGIVCVLKWKKDAVCTENLKRGEITYIVFFALLSLLLGLESFVTHAVAFVFGVIVGVVMVMLQKREKTYAKKDKNV